MKDYKYDFYPYGVWSHETVLRFDASGDLASHVSETGNAEVKARALDETVFEDAPTYIKMDIGFRGRSVKRVQKNHTEI